MPERWKFHCAGPEDTQLEIEGVRIWQHKWLRAAQEQVEVRDPHYGQTYQFDIYEIHNGEKSIKFAAGEFSASVWGFYVFVEEC